MDALKLLLIFIMIVLAIRRNIPVGIVLFGASLLMALIFGVEFSLLLDGFVNLLKSNIFITLTSVVILVTALGSLLKDLKHLDLLADSVTSFPGGVRTAVASLPPLIGLMPMPGGSLMSAPLVENVLKGHECKPEFKVTINYWFRHIAEFCWPIYPGIILTEGITGMAIFDVAILQFPLSIISIIIGYFFFVSQIKSTARNGNSVFAGVLGVIRSVWPIFLAIILYGPLDLNLSLSLLLSLLALIAVKRPAVSIIWSAMKTGLNYKLFSLIFGVLSFQMVIELASAVEFIPELSSAYNFPPIIIVFLVTFVIGLLTGMMSAFVGLGYALLSGFLYQPVLQPELIMFAYVSGFLGVMLSPSHLCLILTNEYFGSNLGKVYQKLFPPAFVLLVLALGLYFSGWGSLFPLD